MKDDLFKIFNHFGKTNQILKIREEVEEVIEAIILEDKTNLIDEIADVYVLLMQFQFVNAIETSEITNKIGYKINRTLERIDSGYYENNVSSPEVEEALELADAIKWAEKEHELTLEMNLNDGFQDYRGEVEIDEIVEWYREEKGNKNA